MTSTFLNLQEWLSASPVRQAAVTYRTDAKEFSVTLHDKNADRSCKAQAHSLERAVRDALTKAKAR